MTRLSRFAVWFAFAFLLAAEARADYECDCVQGYEDLVISGAAQEGVTVKCSDTTATLGENMSVTKDKGKVKSDGGPNNDNQWKFSYRPRNGTCLEAVYNENGGLEWGGVQCDDDKYTDVKFGGVSTNIDSAEAQGFRFDVTGKHYTGFAMWIPYTSTSTKYMIALCAGS
jgi:hypothetical protein